MIFKLIVAHFVIINVENVLMSMIIVRFVESLELIYRNVNVQKEILTMA